MTLPLLLHAYHSGANADFEPMGEWIVPWHYLDFESEYQSLNQKAALVDCSYQALIEIRGPDRADFLQRLLTNDIARLQAGMGCRAFLLDASGHIHVDFKVLCHKDHLWLCCDASIVEEAMRKLEQYHFSEDIEIRNLERSYAVLSLRGPKVIEVSGQLFNKLAVIPGPYDHEWVTFENEPVLLMRNPLPLGIEMLAFVPEARAQTCWNEWLRRGTPYGLKAAGWHAYNATRIELGQALHLIDFDDRQLLPETSLQVTGANESKGCYVGQEIVARMETYGSANKQLVGLKLQTQTPPDAGARLLADGKEAGWITSVSESPRFHQILALAYVKRPFYKPGTQLTLQQDTSGAEVCKLPFISEL